MDGRKNLLAAKQEVISEAFSLALETVESMPRPLYTELMKQVVLENAQDGDVIHYNAKDADVFNEEFMRALKAQCGDRLSISLGKPIEDIQSGVVLQSGAMERNCSIEALLRIVREQEEAQVAAILFD